METRLSKTHIVNDIKAGNNLNKIYYNWQQ